MPNLSAAEGSYSGETLYFKSVLKSEDAKLFGLGPRFNFEDRKKTG